MSEPAIHLTGADLITSSQYRLRNRSELHALAFLARYRVEHTRQGYETALLDANVPERDIALSTGHADTRMVGYYDRGREAIGRNATHAVAAWVEGAS